MSVRRGATDVADRFSTPEECGTTDSLPLTGPHWTFALDLYRQPGVAEACLWLQDARGVDVNVLLFALFAACKRGVELSPSHLALLDDAVASWRSEVVGELRLIRRRLKVGPAPAPSATTEALRNLVKAAELRAEQIEQAFLAQWLDRTAPAVVASVDLRELLRRVVRIFARKGSGDADVLTEQDEKAIQEILHQVKAIEPGKTDRLR